MLKLSGKKKIEDKLSPPPCIFSSRLVNLSPILFVYLSEDVMNTNDKTVRTNEGPTLPCFPLSSPSLVNLSPIIFPFRSEKLNFNNGISVKISRLSPGTIFKLKVTSLSNQKTPKRSVCHSLVPLLR